MYQMLLSNEFSLCFQQDIEETYCLLKFKRIYLQYIFIENILSVPLDKLSNNKEYVIIKMYFM